MNSSKNHKVNEKKTFYKRNNENGQSRRTKEFISPEKQFEKIVDAYFESNPFHKENYKEKELEVRFSNKSRNFTKIDYDNVIKKIKSLGFSSSNQGGNYLCRIITEFLDPKIGSYRNSDVRVEIEGMQSVQAYCKSNNLGEMIKSIQPYYIIKFNKKFRAISNDGEKIQNARFNDFGFNVSYDVEESVSHKSKIATDMVEKWNETKKSFRYLNRVSFTREDIPISIDISIVKTSEINKDGSYKNVYTVQESNVFNNPEFYEIELEVINSKIGPGTEYTTAKSVLNVIKKTIKYILSGLQNTNYPIPYSEQKLVINEYMTMLYGEGNYNPHKITSKSFIGPSSYPLQIINISEINTSSKIPNIRENFSVTEKADGARHLMYISSNGRIYLIDTSMNIIFTGGITKNKDIFKSLIDGELILHNKMSAFINLFASFDIYFINNKNIRSLEFINTPSSEEDEEQEDEGGRKSSKKHKDEETRYNILINTIKSINAKSVVNEEQMASINITYKKFYSTNLKNGFDIFQACNKVLSMKDSYEYEIDGIIFTHMRLGVGSTRIGEEGEMKKISWVYSFKWKPPKYNTIDFLVETVKNSSNQDEIKTIFEDGLKLDSSSTNQIGNYKTVILKCGFDEKQHGYLNPCQSILDDNFPENDKNNSEVENTYRPVQFVPSNPYDLEAGFCNVMLKMDENETYQMFTEENEVFTDKTIVEFRYELTNQGRWRWIPLRVRYDKTAELKRGFTRNYGNDYTTANGNWKSIHNPISVEMITTGKDIPEEILDDDIYWNRIGDNESLTKGLRDFHNLFVKRKLIYNTSKPGYTLIDFACGKGGDFPKWIDSKLSFVFGIDISNDNITNSINGACARYMNYRKSFKQVPSVLFVNGDCSLNIKNGDSMKTSKYSQITRAVFGKVDKSTDIETLGKGVIKQIGKGENGFNVCSCHFAIHYFFENITTLHNFLRNVSECTKLNGYFIGCSYDGKTVFDKLKKVKTNDCIDIVIKNNKMCQIRKLYEQTEYKDDDSCLGYKIDVYQESINNTISEYLVNYDYLIRILEIYGFIIITREEAKNMGLPQGTGMFEELYDLMKNENNKGYKGNSLRFGEALNMSKYEKEISFLNRYFVFKKISEVDSEKVMKNFLNKSFSEAVEEENKSELLLKTQKEFATEKIKPRVRKTGRKILLIPATEANEEEEVEKVVEEIPIPPAPAPVPQSSEKKIKNPEEKKKNVQKKKKLLLTIEED